MLSSVGFILIYSLNVYESIAVSQVTRYAMHLIKLKELGHHSSAPELMLSMLIQKEFIDWEPNIKLSLANFSLNIHHNQKLKIINFACYYH